MERKERRKKVLMERKEEKKKKKMEDIKKREKEKQDRHKEEMRYLLNEQADELVIMGNIHAHDWKNFNEVVAKEMEEEMDDSEDSYNDGETTN